MGQDVLYNTLIVIAVIWTIIWKGIGLWKSARNNQLVWFVAFLVINLLGLLEITYLLFFQKDKNISG